MEDNMNTDTIADPVIVVDYGESLPNMIAAGKYDSVNPEIAPDKFPVEGNGTKTFRTKPFDYGRSIFSRRRRGDEGGELRAWESRSRPRVRRGLPRRAA
jgi:hypothetical protein